MKNLIVTSIIALLLLAGNTAKAWNRTDDKLGLPGDNLNLYAVMKLFQESKTLEDFERSLNDQNTRVNNLDLNGDNLIDYISVTDHPDGNVHNIVLQVALNANEKQDVAVFTVQRFRSGSVQIQLIGDEALYGKNYIIEPIYADNSGETPNPGYTGSTGYVYNDPAVAYTTFEVSAWPIFSFLFAPAYIAWHSLWSWNYWPSYWHPWHPYYWDYYYGYQYSCFPDYYRHYHQCNYYSYHRYHDFYYNNVRSYSTQVNRRISEGDYRATYSHPEQRREGQALYARVNSGNRVSTYSGSGGNNSRRSFATGSDRTNVTSGAVRSNNSYQRSAATGTGRTSANTTSFQRDNTSRRVTSSSSGRTNTGSFSAQSGRSSRSSSPSLSRSTNSFSMQSGRSSRSSAPSFSARAGSRSDQGYRGSTARSFSQSSPRASASAQRSGGGSRAVSSGSGRTNSGGSKENNSSHRR